ncbi:MAG: hypothetical protein AB7I27_13160 [Bacteriovoracaceae bacterium]
MTIISKVNLAFISLFFITGVSFAEEKLQEEKELEAVNFNSIKKVLQKDGLSQAVIEKKEEVKVLKIEQKNLQKHLYNYPSEDEIWGFATDYWLVKNAQLLGWDFDKPDYGLDLSFRNLLEKLGYFQKSFRILLVNTPSVVRAGLPGSHNDMVLLVSVPFIRTLDLSKLEISLLLLEDFFRIELGFFKKSVGTEKMKKLAGTNFYGTKPDLSLIEELLKNYDKQVNEKGFTFQQQFEVTKKMDNFLKGQPDLWNTYFKMLTKIDRFTKSNNQYKDYIKLYPSPEMQIKWLSPEEKVR